MIHPRQPPSAQHRQRRKRRQHVILLPRGERKEQQHKRGPHREQQHPAPPQRKIMPAKLAAPLLRTQRQRPSRHLEPERRPRHHPHQAQPPEQHQRYRVIVMRHAQIQIPQNVLVHEVEPEPPPHIAIRRQRHNPVPLHKMKRRRLPLRRIRQSRQHMPRRRNRQEDHQRTPQMQLSQPHQRSLPSTRQQQINDNRRHRKHNADQPLRQHIQRTARPKPPAVNLRGTNKPGAPTTNPGGPSFRSFIAKRWGIARGSAREMLSVLDLTSETWVPPLYFLNPPETPQRRRNPQTHHRIRNRDPRKDKNPKARQQNQRRIQPRPPRPKHPPRQALAHQRQRQHRKRQRQPHRNGARHRPRQPRGPRRTCSLGCEPHRAKHLQTRSHRPVQQRSFLQIPNSIRIQRHVVVAQQHLARHLRVHGIGIIQQRRPHQRKARIERRPQHHNPHQHRTRTRRRL